jgi:hypothetical protein
LLISGGSADGGCCRLIRRIGALRFCGRAPSGHQPPRLFLGHFQELSDLLDRAAGTVELPHRYRLLHS